VQGKAHTFTIESLNNRIRCHLARLKRRTHNHSKSRENLAASILFFIVNKCGGELASETQSIPIWQSHGWRRKNKIRAGTVNLSDEYP
jgi:hypothetical protein